jgi:hypothetical protein
LDGAAAGTSSWNGRPCSPASALDNPRRARSNGPNGGPAGSHLDICFSCGANSNDCAGAVLTWRHCPSLLADLRDAECIEAYHSDALPYIPKRLKEKFDRELRIAAMVSTRAADAAGSGDT